MKTSSAKAQSMLLKNRFVSLATMLVAALSVSPVHAQSATADMVISTNGFGPIRLGMSLDEAQKAFGAPLRKVTSVADAACFYTLASEERLVLRIKSGKVVSIDTSSAQVGVTRSGLRVGESADKVRATYGKDTSFKEIKSPFDQRPVTVVGAGTTQVALALKDGKVDLIRVGVASDLWGRCEP